MLINKLINKEQLNSIFHDNNKTKQTNKKQSTDFSLLESFKCFKNLVNASSIRNNQVVPNTFQLIQDSCFLMLYVQLN